MAVVPVFTPDTYALTKGGRMRYRFTGSGRFETIGISAKVGLSITAAVPDGTVLKLRWNGQTQTLTARTVPKLPSEFPAGDGSPAYADQLAAYFKSYFPFRADYTVSRVDFGLRPLVIFTARKAGAAYTMAQIVPPGIAGLPAPPPIIQLGVDTAGADAVLRERYGVYLEVYLQRAGTLGLDEADFDLIATPYAECDDDGVADFDAGDLIHGYLSADIPDFVAQGGQLAQDSHRAYYVAYAEAWGSPIRPGLIETDAIRHAYLGGADFDHRSGSGFNLNSFVKGSTADQDRALRFGTTTRAIHLDEPSFLTFVNLRDADQVTLDVVMTFDDDSQAHSTSLQAVIDFTPGKKVCFPVSVGILDLLSQVPAGKFLKEYSVSLKGQAGNLSRPYRFVLDYKQPPYRRYFVYLNSLGAFAGIMTHGKGSAELQRFYDQSEKYLLAGYAPTSAQYVDFNMARQQSFEVATGWQKQTELVQWDDFYGSPVRLQVSGTKVYAIGLTSKSIKQAKDGDTQFAHSFQYVHLHRDEYYTDSETLDGDESLPVIAQPAGTVIVQPLQPVPTIDPTIPAAVRELTKADIDKFKIVAARPNPETLGFLTQSTAGDLFRRADQKVSFVNDLTDKPTTRDQAGILDVPIRPDLFKIIHIKPHLSSWPGDIEPDELDETSLI